MSRASVVLPLPGGPWRIIECGWPSSIARRSADPGASSRSLADELIERLRAHPGGQRRIGGGGLTPAGGGRLAGVEQALHVISMRRPPASAQPPTRIPLLLGCIPPQRDFRSVSGSEV